MKKIITDLIAPEEFNFWEGTKWKQQENTTGEVKPNENNNKPNEQNPNTKPANPSNGNNGGTNVNPPQTSPENNSNNGVVAPPQAGNNQQCLTIELIMI